MPIQIQKELWTAFDLQFSWTLCMSILLLKEDHRKRHSFDRVHKTRKFTWIIDKCIIFTTKHYSTSLGFLTEPYPKKGPWSLYIMYCLFAIKKSFLHIYIIYIIYLYILYIYTFINSHILYIKKWLNVEQFFI